MKSLRTDGPRDNTVECLARSEVLSGNVTKGTIWQLWGAPVSGNKNSGCASQAPHVSGLGQFPRVASLVDGPAFIVRILVNFEQNRQMAN